MKTPLVSSSPVLLSPNLVKTSSFNLILSKQIAKAIMERAVRDDIVAQNTSSLDELRQLLNSV